MLRVQDLYAYYDTNAALKGISLEVPEGKIRCMIGANGAGKSTLLKAISGVVKRSGSIKWNGEEISGYNSTKTAKAGIVHVPEGRQVFPGLTVYENLEVGTISWHGFFGRAKYTEDIDKVFQLLPRLKERSKQGAWSLSGGEQQMLAIGRALMARPKLLMMDEPSMGLAPLIVEEIYERILEINKTGTSILLVEQNARLALRVSEYTYVIEQGEIKLQGISTELSEDPRVKEAYLGTTEKR